MIQAHVYHPAARPARDIESARLVYREHPVFGWQLWSSVGCSWIPRVYNRPPEHAWPVVSWEDTWCEPCCGELP